MINGRGSGALLDDLEVALVEEAQDLVQLVAAACRIYPALADHRPGALAGGPGPALLDPSRAAPRTPGGRPRRVQASGEAVDAVVAPFAGGDHAAVEGEDAGEFSALEEDLERFSPADIADRAPSSGAQTELAESDNRTPRAANRLLRPRHGPRGI